MACCSARASWARAVSVSRSRSSAASSSTTAGSPASLSGRSSSSERCGGWGGWAECVFESMAATTNPTPEHKHPRKMWRTIGADSLKLNSARLRTSQSVYGNSAGNQARARTALPPDVL